MFVCFCGKVVNSRIKGGGPSLRIVASHKRCRRGLLNRLLRQREEPVAVSVREERAFREVPVRRRPSVASALKAAAAAIVAIFAMPFRLLRFA